MIEVRSLHKSFRRGQPPALDGVSFQVEKKEIFGLLGHNGAGKSTTMGILLGMVYPDSGEATIGGVSVQRDREKSLRKAGAIFETPCFYDYMSGWKNLEAITSYSGGVSREDIGRVVELVGLEKRIHDRVSVYSHGMRQRLALAQALLPMPEVLLLDEPTNGLDPDGIADFRRRVLRLREEFGLTILFNSHLLSEVEQVCDRVAILRDGKKVYDGHCKGLQEDHDVYHLDTETWPKAEAVLKSLPDAEISSPGVFKLKKTADPSAVVAALVGAGVPVRQFYLREPSLEDLYMRFRKETEEET